MLEYDDLVYGQLSLSSLVAKHPEVKDGLTRFLSNPNPNPNPNLTPNPNPNPNQVKDGLTRFLYEIILRRMEVTLPSYHPMLPLVITLHVQHGGAHRHTLPLVMRPHVT